MRVEFQGDFFVWEMELEEREGGRRGREGGEGGGGEEDTFNNLVSLQVDQPDRSFTVWKTV